MISPALPPDRCPTGAVRVNGVNGVDGVDGRPSR